MKQQREVPAAIVRLMKSRKRWSGTSTELAAQMGIAIHPRALSAAINAIRPALEQGGILVSNKRSSDERLMIIEKAGRAGAPIIQTQLCQRCGHLFKPRSVILQQVHESWTTDIFCGQVPKDVRSILDICFRCALEVTPRVAELGEIAAIRNEIDQLGELINERRTQNNGATPDHAGARSQGGHARQP